MSGRCDLMLLKGGCLATLDPPAVAFADLRVHGDRIAERGLGLAAHPGEEVLDLEGALVLPGLVNAHTHLYSALARGMPGPSVHPRTFRDLLDRVWWKLDAALDADTVALSALVGAVEAALSGTTVLIDHHSSPSFIRGSLPVVQGAIESVGLRSVLCYEVTDRNGLEGRDRGVEENVVFQLQHQTALTRGMIGAHASFTLSDESLARIADAVRETGSSVHIHVAEDRSDGEECRSRYGTGLPGRLDGYGLLGARALLAHCVHLEPAEVQDVNVKGAWIAHNPRSNMNNTVGYAPTAALRRAALGTDGMDQDMWAESRAAFLQMRESGRDDAYTATLELLAGGHRLAAALFGIPFGKLDGGGPADLVILDYRPPTPLTTENLAGHLLFGVDRSHVRSVIVAGRFVVRDRRITGLDAGAVFARARDAAPALWDRMASRA
ncbi:MAG TPA: amidohydrolase family protein [Vicinamibacteria bacterium]|nr:amidohydrolase family protein [Vicinamibacteria bacterium]